MARIQVLYFAALRELMGRSEEELELVGASDVAGVRASLAELRPALAGRLDGVRVALNESFADDAEPVSDGDVIALIPPVQGG